MKREKGRNTGYLRSFSFQELLVVPEFLNENPFIRVYFADVCGRVELKYCVPSVRD